MSAVESTLTRWRSRETGEMLVAIALKRDEEASMILPIYQGRAPHPLDWMPEALFLRVFEEAKAA